MTGKPEVIGSFFKVVIGLAVLDEVSHLIESVDRSLYEEYEKWRASAFSLVTRRIGRLSQ